VGLPFICTSFNDTDSVFNSISVELWDNDKQWLGVTDNKPRERQSDIMCPYPDLNRVTEACNSHVILFKVTW
jgi:hypothetical protein